MTSPVGSTYESWVLALRKWATDPRHDMSGLPTLQADSLPPSAYERLMGHIASAQQELMSTWRARLESGFAAAKTEQDYGRTLVELRGLLGRRLQLARHAGFPAQIQQALSESVERDVRRLQRELEDAVTQPGRSTIRTSAERLLRVVRSNSLTAILDPGFPLDTLFERPAPPPDVRGPLPAPAGAAAGQTGSSSRMIRRRVVLDDGSHPHSDTEN